MLIVASLSYRVNDLHWKRLLTTGLWLALTLAYSLARTPGWFVGAGFVFAPLIVFCALDARSARAIAGRVAAFAMALALLYTVGLVDYVRTLFAYSSRIYFHSEWFRPQDVIFTSWVFVSPRLSWTYLFFISGWVAGLVFGGRPVRKAALMCLLVFATFLLEVATYLFAPLHWPATLPLYYEILVAPLYALGAMVG